MNPHSELLSLAKHEYQDIHDVRRFADRLHIRPGIVYNTLKEHGFIRQNETTEYRVVNAYFEFGGNLKAIADTTKLPVWICAKTLEKFKYPTNWHQYKADSETANLGEWAENEFKRLVPQSLDMNRQYQPNNPIFDFFVGDKRIDVKCSGKRISRNSRSYNFRYDPAELPDYFCLFAIPQECADIEQGKVNEYHVFLFPSEILPSNKTSFRMTTDKYNPKATSRIYWDFEVQPAALSAILGAL